MAQPITLTRRVRSIATALQLMPSIRSRFPKFHRWVGRSYMVAALIMAVSTLAMLTICTIIGFALFA